MKRMSPPLLAFLIAALAVAAPLRAADPPAFLTLEEAVTQALRSNPSVQAAADRVDQAEAAVREAKTGFGPKIAATVLGTEYEEPMVVSPIHSFSPGNFPDFDRTLIQGALNADYILFDGGNTRSRIEAARARSGAAGAGADLAHDALITRTVADYLTILSLRQTLASHDSRIEALNAEHSRARQLFEVGKSAEVDVLRVEAALAAAEAERVEIASRLDHAERALARRTGLPLERTRAVMLTPVDLAAPVAAERGQLVDAAIASNPAVRQADAQLLARQAEISLARSAYYPHLQAGAAWTDFGDSSLSFTGEWNASLRLRIPIWDGGTTDARVAAARAAAAEASDSIGIAKQDVEEALDSALASRQRNEANATSLSRAVDRFEEVARVEKLRLENGAGTQTDYLRAEADLLSARAALTAARYQSILSNVEIARVTGALDLAWLDQHLRSTP